MHTAKLVPTQWDLCSCSAACDRFSLNMPIDLIHSATARSIVQFTVLTSRSAQGMQAELTTHSYTVKASSAITHQCDHLLLRHTEACNYRTAKRTKSAAAGSMLHTCAYVLMTNTCAHATLRKDHQHPARPHDKSLPSRRLRGGHCWDSLSGDLCCVCRPMQKHISSTLLCSVAILLCRPCPSILTVLCKPCQLFGCAPRTQHLCSPQHWQE